MSPLIQAEIWGGLLCKTSTYPYLKAKMKQEGIHVAVFIQIMSNL